MTEPTQAQITEAVKLKFKFAKGPVIYGGELAELIAHIRRTPRPQGSTMKPDWHDWPTEPGLWVVRHGKQYCVMSDADATQYAAHYWNARFYGPLQPDTKEEQ